MAVAAAEDGFTTAGRSMVGDRVQLRPNTISTGVMTVAVFALVVLAIGVSSGIAAIGLGLAAMLLVGSTLVAAEGEPLAPRAAAMMGTVHVLAVILLSL